MLKYSKSDSLSCLLFSASFSPAYRSLHQRTITENATICSTHCTGSETLFNTLFRQRNIVQHLVQAEKHCSTPCSGRQTSNSTLLAICERNHQWPVVSLTKGPVMQKEFPCKDIIMTTQRIPFPSYLLSPLIHLSSLSVLPPPSLGYYIGKEWNLANDNISQCKAFMVLWYWY